MSDARQTWFVTGASSGFGRAIAEHALEQGHAVVATARDPSRIEDLAARAPDRTLAIRLDVTHAGEAEAAVAAAVSAFGRIDVVVDNAGYGIVGAVEETDDPTLRAIMETNFFGAAAVIRAVLPQLRAQASGAIVNISSLGGQLSYPGFGAYSASKFALEGLSEALAAEVAPLGIKVMIVEPGAFRTEFAGAALRHLPVNEAYAGTVGQTRRFAREMDRTQPGDPKKAAAAIAQALARPRPPLRLALGGDAVDAIRSHAVNVLGELAVWEEVARATAVDMPDQSSL